MPHLLDDCWMLIRRAEKQFDALHIEIVTEVQKNPPSLVIDDDLDTGEKVVYFGEEPSLPREWGADVGQLMTNARTALDHLVYALAIEGGGNPEQARTAFPIFEDRDDYWQVRGRGARKTTVRDQYLAGVEERWRKRIDAVQPYRRGKRASLDPLAILADVTNSYKHKTLKPARVAIDTPSHVAFTTSGQFGNIVVRFHPRNPQDISVEAKFDATPRSLTNPQFIVAPKNKMKADGFVDVGLVFGGTPPPLTLGQVKRAVAWSRAIITWFEPAFDPGV